MARATTSAPRSDPSEDVQHRHGDEPEQGDGGHETDAADETDRREGGRCREPGWSLIELRARWQSGHTSRCPPWW